MVNVYIYKEVVTLQDTSRNEMLHCSSIACHHDNGSKHREREDSHVLGIWTRFIVLYAFFAPGPAILVGHPGSTDLGLDTLVQL